MEKKPSKKSKDAPSSASTPRKGRMVNKTSKKNTDAPTPCTGAPQRKAFLLRKKVGKGERTLSARRAWLAMPFMVDRVIFPGPLITQAASGTS